MRVDTLPLSCSSEGEIALLRHFEAKASITGRTAQRAFRLLRPWRAIPS